MINVFTLTRFTAFATVAFLAGCGGDDVHVYQVPSQPELSQASAPSENRDQGPATPVLEWKLPEGWEEMPPSEMRAATFRVKNDGGKLIDVSVIPLPGLAGKDLDNVNRWRGQVGQPPLTEADLAKAAEPVSMEGHSAAVYDQAGENVASGEKQRIVAAILRRDGTAWFFKMMGDDEIVAKQKPAFIEFLKSVSFKAGPADAGTMTAMGTTLPASHPPITGLSSTSAPATIPSAGESGGKPKWTVPEGWQEVSGGQFLAAKFQIPGPDNSQAAVNVSTAVGEGGGLAGNVNRWRKQVGLDELGAEDIQKQVTAVESSGARVSLVDISGTDPRTSQKVRIVGAIAALQGETWFFKLMGPEALVDREKASFVKFVQSVKYGS